jgi:hypothetical protein
VRQNSIGMKFIDFQPVPSSPRTHDRNIAMVHNSDSAAVRERRDLALENLALRQQLAVLKIAVFLASEQGRCVMRQRIYV